VDNLITYEEWAALLGIEAAPVNMGGQKRQNNRRSFERIRRELRTAPKVSAQALSLRDVISNAEIAALLTRFSAKRVESRPTKVRKIKS